MTGSARTLRLATYNVQGRLWAEDGGPASAVHEVLEELDADVLALQEVHPPRSLPPRWEDSQGVAYDVVYGPTLTRSHKPFGNALLSRFPVTRVRRIDLSLPRCEPRGAIDVRLDVEGLELTVIGTHLGLAAHERRAQVRRLLQCCIESGADPLALMGDINEWRPRSTALFELESFLGPAPRVRSFPSRWPLFALDRVWTRPRQLLRDIAAHRTERSYRASDHLPVVATLTTEDALGSSGTEMAPTGF